VLYTACEQGHDAAVRLLLQHGANSIEEKLPVSRHTLCCDSGTP